MAGTTADVQLEEVTVHALDFVSRNENGFVMMLEQAYIDKYSHNNDFNGVIKSVSSLNKTVEVVMNWIGDRTDTAVLITADHETGGLHVNNTTNYGLTYQGKNGPIYYKWDTTNHTRSNVSVFVYGIKPDFASFDTYKTEYLIKNTDIFRIMKQVLDENSAKKAS
jgi:alkaline phosphatase